MERSSDNESWKTGYLYEKADDPKGTKHNFRQSAFTMFATSKDLKSAPDSGRQQTLDCHCWTILLLTPPDFFAKPLQDSREADLVWKEIGKHQYKPIAELTCIVHALKGAVDRWTILYQYIGNLLREDFMDPKAYVKLLFDDETFSQSRLYFWVIGCLNEFDISIEDNIKQWTLFREARVTPFLEKDLGDTSQNGDSSPAPDAEKIECQKQFRALDKEADDLRETLENWRLQFQNQQRTVLALRDGALWAIPNITGSGTRNPFIITAIIVGFVTYITVFNLGNIAELSSRTYHNRRTKLLTAMRKDSGCWKERGEKFGEFRPDNDRKTPSEWWIMVYQIRTLVSKMR
ncbi:hypothetical protein OEA41_006802 [Lepraria neglecta]|uniref:Uncharacterized protein n=1 Tax=Lepraria neglecta TaxID=209136 RepID=A0AAE0DNE1_9LECA|nr:hypothetical protein OEA41_006802 [Lepraria neglecta]